ncbi:MAG: hypothetical protein ACQEUH_07295, partial [Pseudomonadota bacterium]
CMPGCSFCNQESGFDPIRETIILTERDWREKHKAERNHSPWPTNGMRVFSRRRNEMKNYVIAALAATMIAPAAHALTLDES